MHTEVLKVRVISLSHRGSISNNTARAAGKRIASPSCHPGHFTSL